MTYHHEAFMRLAMNVARRNPKAPFGSILVNTETDEVVSEGVNRAAVNPIFHGEIDAINRHAERGAAGWTGLRLYTTAEPCCMCQAAILWAGIPEVVFGTSITKLKALGWHQFDLTASDVLANAPFAQCKIIGGVLAVETDQLFEQARV